MNLKISRFFYLILYKIINSKFSMDRHEIKCINKSNQDNFYQGILSIGGLNSNGTRWRITIQRAIEGMESGKWSFYVNVNGQISEVIISSYNGVKYLKTKNDGTESNNLLSLPECLF